MVKNIIKTKEDVNTVGLYCNNGYLPTRALILPIYLLVKV